MKAISTIIAAILLVVITIGLVSTAYLFVGGVLTGSISKTISLVGAKAHRVIVRNDGTDTIASDDIKISVNGQEVEIINPQQIEPQDTAILKFVTPELEIISAKVNVLGPSNTLSYTTDVIPHEFKKTSETAGLWHFNEGSGSTTRDSSNYGNDGTLVNMEAGDWKSGTDCVFGVCLDFDGDNDFVNVPDTGGLDGMNQLTLECWMKFNEFIPGEAYPCIGKPQYGSPYELVVHGNKEMEFCVATGIGWNCINPGVQSYLTTGTWYHIAATYKPNGEGKIYVNGGSLLSYTNSFTVTGNIVDNANPVQFGKGNDVGRIMNGTIDEVAIYNKALSQEEILDSIYG